jgi:hypothetical protein
MSDHAATARKYQELATRAADPNLAEAYRNLASGYRLLARGTELLRRHGATEDEAGKPNPPLPSDPGPTQEQ